MVKEKREKLIESNLGLVHSCAGRFKERGVEYDDLFQAGCVGLCKAADGFDEERGFAFSTYAVPVILGEIKRLFRDGGSVKVGRTLKEKSRKTAKIKEKLEAELGREPTVSEIAQRIGESQEETAFLLNASLPVLSLTTENDDGTSENDIPIQSEDERIIDSVSLREIIGKFEERDIALIELRYFRNLTQTKTAQQLGMSQVQVSRREKKILTHIRSEMIK